MLGMRDTLGTDTVAVCGRNACNFWRLSDSAVGIRAVVQTGRDPKSRHQTGSPPVHPFTEYSPPMQRVDFATLFPRLDPAFCEPLHACRAVSRIIFDLTQYSGTGVNVSDYRGGNGQKLKLKTEFSDIEVVPEFSKKEGIYLKKGESYA